MANGDQVGQETDLYTLFSALTGLTGEIRLQGRSSSSWRTCCLPWLRPPRR